ncbi:hypothetical protein [Micromonospora sp. WMMD975]|uniref:hypothetical protein n=1 Tax=Micromonospora sp. WMMD975 TaxID=3016087 RepID=UPI00249C77DB|nr:hypothetical protein [Micromonospora sp. WMMD975]WFE30944.1 hypothetical protein O7613_14900 [Micromonospora sp. WMMD975]
MTDQRTGPPHGRFHVHVHRPRTSPEVGAGTDETVILDPLSGRPWLSGRWPRWTVRQVDTDALRVALIGTCGLAERALAEQVIRSADHYDPGALARLPGSFLTFVRTPYGTYAAGDVAGLHRLWLTAGALTAGPAGGAAAVPEAVGVHLYDDGAHRLEPYWAPPRADLPATVTGPLIAQRLRTAVRARASTLGATIDADDAARRLLDGYPVPMDSPRGRLTLLPTGVESLLPPGRQTRRRLGVDRRLSAVRASAAAAAADPDLGWLLQLPLLDAHILQVALATRPSDLSRDRLRAEATQAVGR